MSKTHVVESRNNRTVNRHSFRRHVEPHAESFIGEIFQTLINAKHHGVMTGELVPITHRFSASIFLLRRKYHVGVVTQRLENRKFRYVLSRHLRHARKKK